MKNMKQILFILAGALLFSSCDKFFDIQTENLQLEEETYKDKNTIYAGMIGLSASFRSLAEHHILLTELLGDLMTPTHNAPDEYWDVYRYKQNSDRADAFAAPTPYYRLVVDCNDFLRHLMRYKREYPNGITENIYKGLVSTAIGYRAWAYLQIGKLYGEAYYYDLANVDVDQNLTGRLLSLDQLLPELLFHLEKGVDGVNGYQTLDWRIMIDPNVKDTDFDPIWNRVSIDPYMLLCEIHLWRGDYIGAAKTGIDYMSGNGDNFKMNVFVNGNSVLWNDLFGKDLSKDHAKEAMTVVPFDYDLQQTHQLQNLFSNTYPAVYYFAPNTTVNRRFIMQIDRVEIDPVSGEKRMFYKEDKRGAASINYGNGQLFIQKYHYKKLSHEQDAPIYIYRTAELMLMIAEALNGIGNNAAADSLLNVGFEKSWSGKFFNPPFDMPIYGTTLSKVKGVRSRAGMKGNYVRYYVDTLNLKSEQERKVRREFVMDSLICEETALELAYEGKRWFNMLRVARNKKRPECLAVPVSQKFGTEAKIYEIWLMDPKNWFIHWNHTEIVNKLNTITQ